MTIGFKPDNSPKKPYDPNAPRVIVQGLARNNNEQQIRIPTNSVIEKLEGDKTKQELENEYRKVLANLEILTGGDESGYRQINALAEHQKLLIRKLRLENILGLNPS